MIRLYMVFLLAGTLFITGCHRNQRVTKANLAYVYYDDPTIVHPQFKVYHKNDSISTFYILINASEVLYSKNNPEKKFLSQMTLHVDVYDWQNDKKLLDSGTVRLIDREGMEEYKYLMGELDLKLPKGNYFAEVTFDDLYRMQFVQNIVPIDKSNKLSGQNFQVFDANDNLQFNHYFNPGKHLTIQYNGRLKGEVYLKYYEKEGALPAPPFAVENMPGYNYEPDSTSYIKSNDQQRFEITLDRPGIYHLQADETAREGLTLVVMGGHYPYIKSVDAMLRPMRYITTKQEFQELAEKANTKKAIDEFWLGIAGNAERARDIIKAYYSRVEIANRFFTSYYPGWKSDRGLIYMIYGPPNVIFKTPHYEKWTYSEKSNSLTEEFTFYKVENIFSENDFYLSRSTNYKSGWYRAIDNWRQGRVY